MPDNPHPQAAAFFALPDPRLLAIEGRDAVAFAQAQTMNDVAALAEGTWQWSGWLTPKGRVVALFALLRLDPETLWLLLPDADPDALAGELRRFVFRSKVTISPRADWRVDGAFAAPARAREARIATAADDVELDLGAAAGPRTLRIRRGTEATAQDTGALARWAAFDLAHGLPRLPSAQASQWTPQQLSLERLRAFSVKKGCYPGQEIVARTHFLGQAKRGLALLEAEAPLAVGAEVADAGQVLGTVVSTASSADAHLGLAVLPLERSVGSILSAGGVPATEHGLLDGLAR